MITPILLIVACILLAGFYAGAETGAYRLNRVRLRSRAEAGLRTARLTELVTADMERFVTVTLVASNAAVYGATVFCTALVASRVRTDLVAELVSTLILAPLLLVFAEVIPKSIFQVLADPLMRAASAFLWFTDRLLWPVVMLLLGVVGFWRRVLVGRDPPRKTVVTTHYLESLLTSGTQEGVISPQQDLMVRNIMQVGDWPVGRIMTPLARVRMLPSYASGHEVLHDIARFNHSRLPVWEGQPGNIIGILRVLDYLCEGEGGEIRKFIQKPSYLDAETGVDEAFRALQEAGQAMAVVVDARKRALGIVTTDDLLQGIVSTLGRP